MSKKGSADFFYILSDAFRSLRENIGTTILTSFTLAFSLAIFSLFVFVLMNLNGVVEGWSEKTQLVVYMKDSQALHVESARAAIGTVPGVRASEFVSKEEALDGVEHLPVVHLALLVSGFSQWFWIESACFYPIDVVGWTRKAGKIASLGKRGGVR